MHTFKIFTLGCKVNTYESMAMAKALNEAGYIECKENEEAEICIVHTCAVTNNAAFKSRQKVNQAKKDNPNSIIVAVGCYVQTKAEEAKENPNIDICIGNNDKGRIVEIIEEYFKTKQEIDVMCDISQVKLIEDMAVDSFNHQCRAYLKVQDGCNQFCSYCIIPYSRGRERSLPLERCLEIANKLVANGHHEIVLTGIHTGRYGRDVGSSFNELLIELCKIDGLDRIRLSSIEGIEFTEEVIDTIANNPKIARHLHIPLQAGADNTLQKMCRPYRCAEYKAKLDEIRAKIPNVAISSDVIVGFPTETDQDYEDSKNFIKECELSFLHVFPFSAREGTPAAKMKNVFVGDAKKQRAKDLGLVSKELKNIYYNKFLGKELEVMIESSDENYYYGYSSEYIWCKVEATDLMIGKICRVRVKEVSEDSCLCEVL